tara:strand:+ start:309 stop:728 length:420 start_codon:yes stop_codon:yes gene_type:complete
MNKKNNFISYGPDDTFNFGVELSSKFKNGDIIGLIGNLAAGKTTFVKGFLKGLNYKYEVTSPTFTLVNEYEAKNKVIHIDFYREPNIKRWNNIGFSDIINDNAIIIIEWADLLLDLLPENTYKIYFEHDLKNKRKIYIK